MMTIRKTKPLGWIGPEKPKQIKCSFDKKSITKMGKGALMAATGGAALFILNALKGVNMGILEPIVVVLVPALLNMVKEWIKGNE